MNAVYRSIPVRAFSFLFALIFVASFLPLFAFATSKEGTAVSSQEASGAPLGSDETTYGAPKDAVTDFPKEPKVQKKDPHAKRVREIASERTPTTKTYELSDGRRQVVVSSAELHYKKNNSYVDIAPMLVAAETSSTPGMVETLSTEATTTFSSTGEGAASISEDGYSLSLSYCGAELSAPLTLGNNAFYLDCGDGLSLQYQALSHGVKETLLLTKPTTKTSYDFRIDFEGLRLHRNKKTKSYELIKSNGKVVYELSNLIVTDSSKEGVPSICPNASWQLLSSSDVSARFRANLDKGWLTSKDCVWPIKIDPSVSTIAISAAQSGTVLSSNPTLAGLESDIGFVTGSLTPDTQNIVRSYFGFDVPNLSGEQIDSAKFHITQVGCLPTDSAMYPARLSLTRTPIPDNVTWDTRPEVFADYLDSDASSDYQNFFYNVTPFIQAQAEGSFDFYGFELSQPEAEKNTSYLDIIFRLFCSSQVDPGFAPQLVLTYSTGAKPVTGLEASTTPSSSYFRETDKNKDGAVDNKNDYVDAGRGSVDLSWNADSNAAGYNIYLWDGKTDQLVGTIRGKDNTTWSSEGTGIYPSDTTLDGFSSGNPYIGAQTPSQATLSLTTSLSYPAGTPLAASGARGSGLVVPSGKYLYVKSWANYTGPNKWVRFGKNESTNPSTLVVNTSSALLQATTSIVPQASSAFALDGVLWQGSVTNATAGKTTIVGYAESTFDSSSAQALSLTFDEPLLNRGDATDISAGYNGFDVMLATDNTYIYSAGKTEDGFKIRRFSDAGHFIDEFKVSVPEVSPFLYFDGMTCDGNNLYLFEWTATTSARTYKISLASQKLINEWIHNLTKDEWDKIKRQNSLFGIKLPKLWIIVWRFILKEPNLRNAERATKKGYAIGSYGHLWNLWAEDCLDKYLSEMDKKLLNLVDQGILYCEIGEQLIAEYGDEFWKPRKDNPKTTPAQVVNNYLYWKLPNKIVRQELTDLLKQRIKKVNNNKKKGS